MNRHVFTWNRWKAPLKRIKGLNKRALEEYAIKKEVMQSANLIVNLEVNRFVFLSFII